ncbi:hypothetical protein SADUNF_Sadunf15G0046200 [Salix dunnii]|uniref:TF-B3 domain-containing protein n=1 Tax=Salix dunnii TaxID=1413687 RepID=A0A835MKY5_9ROSI|nr:hypothetical protein SADUNF_Sadunf15G0046200 [Salix dunnii]
MVVEAKVHQLVPYDVSMKSESHKRRRDSSADLFANCEEVKADAMIRAKDIQANLAPEFPSIIKHMVPSNVTGGFCLSLGRKFCDAHLQEEDTTIFLEGEGGKSYPTKYLARKSGLSGGWRFFAIDHNLKGGDIVVFHLVNPNKFKVYIARVNGSQKDGAHGLLKLEACVKPMNCISDAVHVENLSRGREEMKDQVLKPLLLDNPEEISEKNMVIHDLGPRPVNSENESEDLGFEITDGIRMSESVVDFKEVKSFEDFDILVNGLVINCELSKRLQIKYYELCCSQKSFLHEHLLDGLNCKLVAGMLAETIKIADAIRASKLTTSRNDFTTWENTLKSFHCLGMNVGFLLARLGRLVTLSDKSKRVKVATLERVNAEMERRSLEAKLLEVKETMNRLDFEIETLEMNSENLGRVFEKMATALW